ncbi:hypothetical protein [Leifsonia poae]|uniref:hypothetical protein n=1 Tax=Leifsonia poae TaxID=110933 RepID=UPI001CC19906|nr:hypothetical protein [Leifsonia poae]
MAGRGARPQVRWGGVVWGLILIVFAAGVLWVVSARSRLAAAEVWFWGLSPASAWTLAVVVAGAFILILAVLGAIRSGQRRSRA